MARALKSGVTERLEQSGSVTSNVTLLEVPVHNGLDAYRLLTLQLTANVDGMRERLFKSSARWKI